MFLDFFLKLRDSKIPVTLREYLSFLEGFQLNIVQFDINKFYYLARTSLVKDEKLIDRFDIVFGNYSSHLLILMQLNNFFDFHYFQFYQPSNNILWLLNNLNF